MKKIVMLTLLTCIPAQHIKGQSFESSSASLHKKAQKNLNALVNYLKSFFIELEEKPINVQLRQAVNKGNLELVNQLIAQGANVNSRDKANRASSLHYAASKGILDIIKALVKAGAQLNLRDNNGNTPLHHTKTVNSAKLLIDLGADITQVNKQNNISAEQHVLAIKDASGKPSSVLAEVVKRAKANQIKLKDEL